MEQGCVRAKAVSSWLWGAEVQVNRLSLPEGNLALNLALPSHGLLLGGRPPPMGFCSFIILLDPISRVLIRIVPRILK